MDVPPPIKYEVIFKNSNKIKKTIPEPSHPDKTEETIPKPSHLDETKETKPEPSSADRTKETFPEPSYSYETKEATPELSHRLEVDKYMLVEDSLPNIKNCRIPFTKEMDFENKNKEYLKHKVCQDVAVEYMIKKERNLVIENVYSLHEKMYAESIDDHIERKPVVENVFNLNKEMLTGSIDGKSYQKIEVKFEVINKEQIISQMKPFPVKVEPINFGMEVDSDNSSSHSFIGFETQETGVNENDSAPTASFLNVQIKQELGVNENDTGTTNTPFNFLIKQPGVKENDTALTDSPFNFLIKQETDATTNDTNLSTSHSVSEQVPVSMSLHESAKKKTSTNNLKGLNECEMSNLKVKTDNCIEMFQLQPDLLDKTNKNFKHVKTKCYQKFQPRIYLSRCDEISELNHLFSKKDEQIILPNTLLKQTTNSPEKLKSNSTTISNDASLHQNYNLSYERSLTNNLSTDTLILSKKKPFTCDKCHKTFSAKSSLKTHMIIHSGKKSFSCSTCSHTFYWKHNLKTHMPVHSDKKGSTCAICNSWFSKKSCLKDHMLIHSSKKFVCTICRKPFLRKCNFDRHMQVHSDKEKFSCNV